MSERELRDALAANDGVSARTLASYLPQDERWSELATAAASSPLAVEILIEELDTSGLVRRFVRRSLLDHDAIDDVSQDTLISIAHSVAAFAGRSSVSTWVHQIAQRRVVDHLRRQRATAPLPEDDIGPSQRISSMIATRETVRDAIGQLPQAYRDPLRMRDIDGLTYQDIADRLDRSVGTVKSQISRGRAMVAAAMGAER